MAKLTAKTRKAIPTAKFALPGRRYPVHDKPHAANAKARAKQQLDKGNLSQSQYKTVVAKANKVLKKGAPKRGK
jgi:hypothetical protein